MRKLLKRHDIYVPRVFQDISTSRILVTEFIDGVLVSDYIRVSQQDPERIRRWCLANNVDPKKVGKRLFQSAMRPIFEDNLFHADIHPGNIMLLDRKSTRLNSSH